MNLSWFISISLSISLFASVSVASPTAVTEEESPTASQTSAPDTPRPIIGDPRKLELPKISPGEDLTIEQALALADKRNLPLAAAKVDIENSQAALKRAWAALLPTASGSLNLTHNDHDETVDMGGGESVSLRTQDTLQGSVRASVPLVNAQLWLGVGAGRIGVEAAELTTENLRQEILLNVAQAFYQALTARSLIEVQETLYKNASRHYEVALTRHVSGVGGRLDVIRARSELVRIRQELVSAHAAFNNSRDALAILTGLRGLPVPVQGTPLPSPEMTEDDLLTSAERRRPDLKLRRKLVELNEQQLSTSWMQFLPTLDASWQLTHQFTAPSSFGSTDRSRWNLLLTLSVPIYNQTRYADLDAKRASLKKARIEAQDALEQAGLDVRRTRRDYLTAVTQLQSAEEQAALSKETLLLTETAYENGTGSSLEVTDASRTSRQDQVTLVIRQLEVQLALLKVLKAIGLDIRTPSSPDNN